MGAVFMAALTLGGVVLAVIDRFIVSSTPLWDAMSFLNLHTALALLLAIFCLQVFGNDQPVFWRESSSGMNVFAYFQSRPSSTAWISSSRHSCSQPSITSFASRVSLSGSSS